MIKSAASAIAILALSCLPAVAAPIVFDAAGTRGFDFTAIGGGQLSVCTANCLFDISGNAFSGPDTGTFDLGPFGPVIIGPEIAGVFPVPANSESFTFAALDGDTLSGNVEWSEIDDGTMTPLAKGTLHVASSSGDAFWMASWGGAPFDVPIEFRSDVDCSLHALAGLDCPGRVVEAVFKSGGTLDRSVDVPEPSSIPMLAAFLLMVWGAVSLRGMTLRKAS